MPRYFFDLHNHLDTCDPEGKLLPDLDAAIVNAIKEAREMMQQSIAEGKLNLQHYIDVRDESGEVVYTLPFADAVTIKDGDEFITESSFQQPEPESELRAARSPETCH